MSFGKLAVKLPTFTRTRLSLWIAPARPQSIRSSRREALAYQPHLLKRVTTKPASDSRQPAPGDSRPLHCPDDFNGLHSNRLFVALSSKGPLPSNTPFLDLLFVQRIRHRLLPGHRSPRVPGSREVTLAQASAGVLNLPLIHLLLIHRQWSTDMIAQRRRPPELGGFSGFRLRCQDAGQFFQAVYGLSPGSAWFSCVHPRFLHAI